MLINKILKLKDTEIKIHKIIGRIETDNEEMLVKRSIFCVYVQDNGISEKKGKRSKVNI